MDAVATGLLQGRDHGITVSLFERGQRPSCRGVAVAGQVVLLDRSDRLLLQRADQSFLELPDMRGQM
jgi:hypothetical protein